MKGREKQGIVDAGTEESVSNAIIEKLTKLTDPQDGQPTVKNVYKNKSIYSGNQTGNSPDLIIGFEDGFRGSWQTAIGGAPAGLMEDNLKKWSGDHIIDPSLVPGILLTNFAANSDNPSQMDLAPTVLSCFGMSADGMDGKSLL
jgi:predicted AlkP superfamily phosphohydrolase/phosphomutase